MGFDWAVEPVVLRVGRFTMASYSLPVIWLTDSLQPAQPSRYSVDNSLNEVPVLLYREALKKKKDNKIINSCFIVQKYRQWF